MGRSLNYRFKGYPNWEDLRFPAQGINPPGLVSDPDVETDTGMLLFDGASTEIVMGVAQMPHTWWEGTEIRPHVHWKPTTAAAGNVLWRFEYEIFTIGSDPTKAYTAVDTLMPALDAYDIESLGYIDMAGWEASALIAWKLSRIGGDLTDTYEDDVRLYEFDIHYQIDALGSEEEYTKYTEGE